MKTPEPSATARPAGTLADAIVAWLDAHGVERTGLAVDFVDVFNASARAEQLVRRMLASEGGAAAILDELAKLHAWLFGELQFHLSAIEEAGPRWRIDFLSWRAKDHPLSWTGFRHLASAH